MATDQDRALASYIATVFSCVHKDDYSKVINCMASIIASFNAGDDVFYLAANIAEHG